MNIFIDGKNIKELHVEALAGKKEPETVLVVAATLINKHQQILMAKRPKGKHMAGKWEFPGGKVHRDETPEQALSRELKEELGISVSPLALLPFTFVSHTYNEFHLLMPVFVCAQWQGEIQALEHEEIGWFRPEELKNLNLPDADIPLVDKIIQAFQI